MTDTTQTPAPTLAQLLADRHAKWNAAIDAPRAPQCAVRAWLDSVYSYDAAVTAAALSRPDMTDTDRATLENPPAHPDTNPAHEPAIKQYYAILEKWRAIVHPQEFDAQPA